MQRTSIYLLPRFILFFFFLATPHGKWNYEPCHVGPAKMDRSWWRVLTKHDPMEKGMANHLSILALRIPWTVWKGKKIWHWKMELLRSVGTQYSSGEEQKNSSRKNEEAETKQKQCPLVDVTGDRKSSQMLKGQYCLGTWNVRSMNQGKFKVVKQDGKSEHWYFRNQWTEMDGNRWI